LSAAISHSLIIWLLAALALHFGSQFDVATAEPWFHLLSGLMILSLAVWMFRRTRSTTQAHSHSHGEHDHHGHDHPPHQPHAHGAHGGMMVNTGHGWLEISVFEDGVPPRFRVYPCDAQGKPLPLPPDTILSIETMRPADTRLGGDTSQTFTFSATGDGYWEAGAELPEPHEFTAHVELTHGDHSHRQHVHFHEDHEHAHGHAGSEHSAGHAPAEFAGLKVDDGADAHEREHAGQIARRFAGQQVTTPQIVLFGITGGLMPCPAAFAILLICLQVKRATLGFALVASFSLGLALTLVSVGALAAWSVNHARNRIAGFDVWMRRAPYASCALLVLLAAFMIYSGIHGLVAGATHGHSHG
jgi:nickel/cobalt exporter